MSTHDVISLMIEFGLLQIAGLTLVWKMIKDWFDMQNKKK